MLYNRGIARAALMGSRERTHNPSPAATSMIGKAKVARVSRQYYRTRSSRPHFKGNPLPAILLTMAPQLSKVFGSGPDEKKQALRVAKLDDYSYQVINTKGQVGAKALADLKAVAQRMEGHGVAINDVTVNHARELLQAIGMAATPAAPKKSALDALLGGGVAGAAPGLGTLGALSGLGGQLPAGTKYNNKGQLVQRIFQGNNQFTGKPMYKNVVVRGAAGAAGIAGAGLPGGAAAAGGIGLGGVALAGAAGAAAYLMTSLLLKHLGGKSISAQKAGVQAAIDHRTVLQQYPQDKAAINKAYFDTLAQLGYDPTTFKRKQSFLERLTSDYFSE